MDSHRERSRLNPSFWLSLSFLAVIATGVITAAGWRWDTRLFPWLVGIPALVLALWQLVADLTGDRSAEEPGQPTPAGLMDVPADQTIPPDVMARRTLGSLAWIAGFVSGIWLVGFLPAIPLFVFFYLKMEARAATSVAFGLSACTMLLIWAVFDLLMNLAWPTPALIALFR